MNERDSLITGLVLALILVVAIGVSPASGASYAQDTAAHDASQESAPAQALTLAGNAITYQGYLTDGGSPANGAYDFSFSLYADAAGTQWVADAPVIEDKVVVDGLFTVVPDFDVPGLGDIHFYFNGEARYLRIGVRPGASVGAFTYLSPLQPLTPTPYAQALPGVHTIQNDTSPSVVGGYPWNSVGLGVVGATIGGGGNETYRNDVYGDYGTVGGGRRNTADAEETTVGGGYYNTAGGAHATVGGGYVNTASNLDTTIAGGIYNTASGESSTVAGGSLNTASGICATAAAGCGNTAAGNYSFAAGRQAQANHAGAFVWADSSGGDFGSSQSDQVRIRAANGAELLADNSSYAFRGENSGNGDGIRAIGNLSAGNDWGALFARNFGSSPAIVANTEGTYSGYFYDDIYVAGSCVGCALVYVAQNDGDSPLEAGDLVAIGGVGSPLVGTSAAILQVHRAQAGSAVIGVVQARAGIVTSQKDGQSSESAERLEGPAAPGEYLFVLVQGVAQVKADAAAGKILPGQRLTASERPGEARVLQTRMVEGMVVTEGAPVVGIALDSVDGETGLVPVMVTLW